jgi:transcriptional regulator GlxA family with amidase domain
MMTISSKSAARSGKRLRVGFLLADRFTLSAFANFVDVLRLAADEADRSRPIHCEWAVLSSDMQPIRASCGVKIQPTVSLQSAGEVDYIVVVGGLIHESGGLSPASLAFLCQSAAAGTPLVGLCTGVFLLYQAGLLNGYRCCVSWFHHEDFLARFRSAHPVSDQIFVVDRDRLTCSGGQSAAHLAAWLVEKHIGRAAASKSLSILIIDSAMAGDQPQPDFRIELHARDALVRRALLRMRQQIESPESIERLAEALQISRRQLERRFRTDLGLSPAQAELRLRLDSARQMLEGSTRSVTEIAHATGFYDVSHFAKVFKAEVGASPATYRRTRATGISLRRSSVLALSGPNRADR